MGFLGRVFGRSSNKGRRRGNLKVETIKKDKKSNWNDSSHDRDTKHQAAAAISPHTTRTDYESSDSEKFAPEEINVSFDNDDLSTLADPPVQGGVWNNVESFLRYNSDLSFSVDAPSYSGASSAGYTLGCETNYLSYFGHDSVVSGPSNFDDESFFQRSSCEEESLCIIAPKGKLGISVDCPDYGPPIINTIKETPPLKDKLRVGDKLVALDDRDITLLTAIEISKLLSKKSNNPSRKLSLLRAVF